MTFKHMLAGVLGLAMATTAGVALADYPEKPVTFIVPWPPGDLEDVLPRMMADEFHKRTGVPAAVVNQPGGSGVVGGVTVANANPDGYTVGSFTIDIPTILTQGPDAQIAPDALEPVGIFLTYPFLVATSADAPYATLEEMVEYSKDNTVRLGHFGYGAAPTYLTMRGVQSMGGAFGAEAAFDEVNCATLANGDADVISTTAQLVLGCLNDITILATITEDRTALAPDVPTMTELVPALTTTLWNGLFVPKGTPQEVKDLLEEVALAVVNSPEAQGLRDTTGALIYWTDAAQAAANIARDTADLVEIRQAMGLD